MAALLLVDIQVDFLPGGALAIPHGDEVLPIAYRLLDSAPWTTVIASQVRPFLRFRSSPTDNET